MAMLGILLVIIVVFVVVMVRAVRVASGRGAATARREHGGEHRDDHGEADERITRLRHR